MAPRLPRVSHESPGDHLNTALRLLTFGGLSVHGETGPIAGSAAQPRRLAVLALIARGGKRGITRGKVLSLLWPDADEDQGRRVVTQALYALRRDLGNDEAILGTQDLRLNGELVWCDVVQFDHALGTGDATHAVELHVAPFLDGFRLPSAPEFERWADDERLTLQHRLHDALEKLAREAEKQGAFDSAARWWRRRAADDPLNTRVAIALMKALAAAGDPAGALKHASIFEALVKEELDLPMEREVRELADKLRREMAEHRSAAKRESKATTMARAGAVALAVLPMAAMGGASAPDDVAAWCGALGDEIISVLAGVPGLRVASRSASWRWGPSPDLAELRATLGAALAIEGSVRWSDAKMRVSLRLVDTGDGHTIWAHRYDRAATVDAFELHAEIAEELAARVAETLEER